MKPTIFATFLFLAASSVLAYPGHDQTKGLPSTLTKGLPPPPPSTLTKGLPPPPPSTLTKGLPPPPPPKSLTKGLPPPPSTNKTNPQTFIDALPTAVTQGLSANCLSTLFSVLSSPEFQKCLPISALLPLLPLVIDPTIIQNFVKDPAKGFPKLEDPLVQFSNGLCAAPKCSDGGIQKALQTIQTGCKADLKDHLIQAILVIGAIYSPTHDSICFKDKKGVFCWDETLKIVVNLPKSPIKIIDGGIIDSVAVADPGDVCTACNRAIVNTFGNFLKKDPDAAKVLAQIGVKVDLLKVGIAVKCGIKFEDGNVGDPGK